MKLEKVNSKNVWEILKLKVSDKQKNFVATNTESIIEAYTTITSGGVAYPFGIYEDGEPIGFLMIGYGIDEEWKNPPEIAKNNYSLWRLMIDEKYQGRGYGRKAIQLALDFIKTWPNGKSEYCYLSYEPENILAKNLYTSFGFVETGDKDGNEDVAVLKLDEVKYDN